jgi:hypothetical protein
LHLPSMLELKFFGCLLCYDIKEFGTIVRPPPPKNHDKLKMKNIRGEEVNSYRPVD